MQGYAYELEVIKLKLKDTSIFMQQIYHMLFLKIYDSNVHTSAASINFIINHMKDNTQFFDVWKNAVSLQYPKLVQWFKRCIHLSLYYIYGQEFKSNSYTCDIPFWKPCYQHFLKVYYVDSTCFQNVNFTKCIIYFQKSWDSFIAINIPLRLEIPYDKMIFETEVKEEKTASYKKETKRTPKSNNKPRNVMRLQIPNLCD